VSSMLNARVVVVLVVLVSASMAMWRVKQPPPRSKDFEERVQVDIERRCYYDAVHHFDQLTFWQGDGEFEKIVTDLRLVFRKERAIKKDDGLVALQSHALTEGITAANKAFEAGDYYVVALLSFLIFEISKNEDARALLRRAEEELPKRLNEQHLCGPADHISWFSS